MPLLEWSLVYQIGRTYRSYAHTNLDSPRGTDGDPGPGTDSARAHCVEVRDTRAPVYLGDFIQIVDQDGTVLERWEASWEGIAAGYLVGAGVWRRTVEVEKEKIIPAVVEIDAAESRDGEDGEGGGPPVLPSD